MYNIGMDKECCKKNNCRKKKSCCCGLKFVSVPAGLSIEMNPREGDFSNAIVRFEETGAVYIYSSEGIPTQVAYSDPEELEREIQKVAEDLVRETEARTEADSNLTSAVEGKQDSITLEDKLDADLVTDSESTNKFVTAEDISKISTAVQPSDIDRVVVADLDLNSNPSTSLVQLDAAKVNLSSGATSSKSIPLPVASSSQAGVMNSATFNAVENNTNDINALLNGSVAVNGLPANPTQNDLTTAWQTATGLTNLVNRAQIYDASNSKIWTYYTNTTSWYDSPAGGQVSINTFTNSSEGVIKGSTNVGQVFAESDGTGSVNGWDALSSAVADNTANKIGTANLTTSGGISKTTTGTGPSTSVDLAISDGGVTASKLDLSSVLDLFYPVGSIYISMDSAFDPNATWGGTWSKLEEGRFLEATTTDGQVGTNVPAGLPNIKGGYRTTRNAYSVSDITGAFTGTSIKGYTKPASEKGAGDVDINFDASNSSAIYSDSVTTVQPKSVRAFIWRRTA